MYKGTSQNAQHAREQIKLSALAHGHEVRTQDQIHGDLKAALRRMDTISVEEKDHMTKAERKKFGLEKLRLQEEMKRINKAFKPKAHPHTLFFHIARETLPKDVFDKINLQSRKEAGMFVPDHTTKP